MSPVCIYSIRIRDSVVEPGAEELKTVIEHTLSDRPIRAVTVGAGRWGRLHMQKLQGIDGVQLVGVVDRAIECARGRAEEFALTQYARSLDTLGGEFDVVSIAVPIPELADVALCAVEHGAHMLIEKPGHWAHRISNSFKPRSAARGEGRCRILRALQSGDSFGADRSENGRVSQCTSYRS